MSMRPFKRGTTPRILKERGEEWAKAWERRQKAGGEFFWPSVDGQKVNRAILPALEEQTQSHCSFCDAYPVSPPSLETIEHFRPKGRFPLEAFTWENLYYCCDFCQNHKRDKVDEERLLLRPDDPAYRFDDYFSWNFLSGELLPNPNATPENRGRAQVTIDTYGLNSGHPGQRCEERDKVARMSGVQQDEHPYRNFLFISEQNPNASVSK